MKNKITLFNLLGLLFLVGNVILIFIAINYRPLNIDGGFNLAMARDLAFNPSSIANIKAGYTPLVTMIFSAVFHFIQTNNFTLFLVLTVFIQLLNAGLLAFISSKILNLNKSKLHFLFQFYLFTQLTMEGINIVLEPWLVLFLLLAIVSLIKFKGLASFLLSGVFCGLAFMSKQYGLASIAIVFSFIFIHQKNRLSIFPFLWVIVGFIFSSTIVIATYRYQLGVSFFSRLEFFTVLGTYGHRSLSTSIFHFAKFLVFYTPYLLLLLFWKKQKTTTQNRSIIFGAVGILSFLPAFYFKQYLHYYHLILPFVIFLSFERISKLEINKYLKPLLVFAFLFGSIWGVRSFYFSFPMSKQNQLELAFQIQKYIPKNSVVYISNDNFQPMRFLCELDAPLKSTYGYGFVENFNDSIRTEMIHESEFLILKLDTNVKGFVKIEELKQIGFFYMNESLN